MSVASEIFEFRGVDKLYIAEVTADTAESYTCGTPIYLAPVAEIGKSVESSSEAHYYDNKALIVINSEGADTITITMAPPTMEKLALITGRSFDEATGMMVDSPRQNKYFALMYRTKGTDGYYRYVSRLKGTFSIPDETNATENDGTDANNTTITFTGIFTNHNFNKGKLVDGTWEASGVKGCVVDARYGLADISNWFNAVQTPDTVSGNGTNVTGVGLAPSALALEVGETGQLTASVLPASATVRTVSYASSAEGVATVDANGLVTAVGAGSATITVTTTEGSYTDTCAVTVTE